MRNRFENAKNYYFERIRHRWASVHVTYLWWVITPSQSPFYPLIFGWNPWNHKVSEMSSSSCETTFTRGIDCSPTPYLGASNPTKPHINPLSSLANLMDFPLKISRWSKLQSSLLISFHTMIPHFPIKFTKISNLWTILWWQVGWTLILWLDCNNCEKRGNQPQICNELATFFLWWYHHQSKTKPKDCNLRWFSFQNIT